MPPEDEHPLSKEQRRTVEALWARVHALEASAGGSPAGSPAGTPAGSPKNAPASPPRAAEGIFPFSKDVSDADVRFRRGYQAWRAGGAHGARGDPEDLRERLSDVLSSMAPLDLAPPATPPPPEPPAEPKKPRLGAYLWAQVMDDSSQQEQQQQQDQTQGQPERFRRVHNFFIVPVHLEKMLLHGVVLCLDTQLWVLTLLPLRVAAALARLLFGRRGSFQARNAFDLLRAALVLATCWALGSLQMSRVYHYIRNQELIKLYVLTAMLEIFDKLCCAFGQDVLDSLFWSVTRARGVRRAALDSVVAVGYMLLHTALLFAHVVTLNVACNSRNNALLTLLLSNNFAEVKTSVFKSFEEQNLFQMSCSDVTERFKLAVFLTLIVAQHWSTADSSNSAEDDSFWQIAAVILAGEVVVDWIKHAFITKFNEIDLDVYGKYRDIFAGDVSSCAQESVSRDHTHVVARRLGLSALPITALILHMARLSWPAWWRWDAVGCAAALAVFAALVAFKLLLGLLLSAHAAHVASRRGSGMSSPRQRTRYLEYLANIERYTLWRGRIT